MKDTPCIHAQPTCLCRTLMLAVLEEVVDGMSMSLAGVSGSHFGMLEERRLCFICVEY